MNLDFILKLEEVLPVFLLVFARISGLLWTLPLTSYTTVPNVVRLGLGMLLSLIAMSLVPPATYAFTGLPELFFALLLELGFGLVLGFGARIIFEGFTMAGSFIGRQMGLLLANVMDPTNQSQTSLISNLWFLLLLMLFLLTNGHYLLIELLARHFQTVPLLATALPPASGETFTGTFDSALDLALRLGLPAMLFLLIVDVAIAFTSRVMPQLNIFFLTLPVKIALGFIVMIISLDVFQILYENMMADMTTYFRTMLHAVAGA